LLTNAKTMSLHQVSRTMTKPIILGIAGGTGAGKTTLAKAVFQAVGGSKNAVYLTHDHYYRDISHKTLEERSKTNFDHPDSLETDMLVKHVQQLKRGETAELPNYDFSTHSRQIHKTLVHPKSIIVVEGILLFTSLELCNEMDMKIFVVRLVLDRLVLQQPFSYGYSHYSIFPIRTPTMTPEC